MDQQSEATALLRPTLSASEERIRRTSTHSNRILRFNVVGILALQLLSTFAWYHLLAPKLQLLELTICRARYETQDSSSIIPEKHWPWYSIDEDKCKQRVVQQSLSDIRGLGVLLDSTCSQFPSPIVL